jgi:hypothetical protein
MIRTALLLCAGLLAAACFACVLPYAPSDGRPGITCPFATSNAFADTVTMVSPSNFDPGTATGIPLPGGAIPNQVHDDLAAAYDLAPQFFKTQLCKLDGVFIAQNRDSWGFRNTNTGKRYLALSMDLWPGGTPLNYVAYEDSVVQRLLNGWTGPRHSPKPHGDPTNAPAVTILGALAHEFGHILFYDTFVRPFRNPPNYDAFCSGNYYSQAWKSPLPNTPIIWRTFGQSAGAHKADDVQITDIQAAVPPPIGDPNDAGGKLERIYSRTGTGEPVGRWASLFGAFSPDEDFVETFRLFVLMGSSKVKLRSLEISIPVKGAKHKHNIISECHLRPLLQGKLSCFQQTFCPVAGGNPCNPQCP